MECTNNTCWIIVHHVVPALGCLTSLLIFAAPIPAIRRIQAQNSLGDINPDPYVCLFLNSYAWFIYSLLLKDFYISVPNLFGILFGIYYTCVAVSKSNDKTCFFLSILFVVGVCAVSICAMISFIALNESTSLVSGTAALVVNFVGCQLCAVVLLFSIDYFIKCHQDKEFYFN